MEENYKNFAKEAIEQTAKELGRTGGCLNSEEQREQFQKSINEHLACILHALYTLDSNYFKELEQITIKKQYFNAPDDWYIHHKDRNTANNAIDNLEVMSREDHLKEHEEELRQKILNTTFYPRCNLSRKALYEHPCWLHISRFTLLRMIASARGRPTFVSIDFQTFKRKCFLENIDLKVVKNRYSSNGIYLSKANITKALLTSKTTSIS